jgi:competence protein ComEC
MINKNFRIKKSPFLFGLTAILIFCFMFVSGCTVEAPSAPQKQASSAPVATPSKPSSAEPSKTAHDQNDLVIKVLDVGQGDSILIRTPKEVVLIDTGDISMRDAFFAHLKREKITSLDKVIITHPHSDHLGGIAKLFEHVKVKHIYDSGFVHSSSTYRHYLTTVSKDKIPFDLVTDGDVIDLEGGISLKVLSPPKPLFKDTQSDINNNSVVVKLVYGNFSMLFAGDVEREAEGRMVKKYGNDLKADILKSPHHGSRSSSSPQFLQKVAPQEVIISLGANNSYNHPHDSVIKRYKEKKIKIYRTDIDGTVTITSDGKNYKISKEK